MRLDCRHPVLQSLAPVARFGHESGFSPDGNTFYATSTALQSITAIDVTESGRSARDLAGRHQVHGMSLSPDGNRAYIADPDGNMLILDTSEIQARKPEPQTREISRLTWASASIPQNAIPFTVHGKPYVLEIDEYNQGDAVNGGDPDIVGAARIIDISDESHRTWSRTCASQVNQPADHAAAAGDPGAIGRARPGLFRALLQHPDACGPEDRRLLVHRVRPARLRHLDLVHPKEIGYYVAPAQPRSENGFTDSNFAMSMPAFVPERREIWWTTARAASTPCASTERVAGQRVPPLTKDSE